MSLLVVGSIAFDSIETPSGSVDNALGGSASYFSVAASHFTKPRLVGVVGEDFPEEHRTLFASCHIDTSGLVTKKGETFRWKGRYHTDMNTRDTLEVHLNVFGEFKPELPVHFTDSQYIFLANSSPTTQLATLAQIQSPKLVLADTMDLWINIEKEALLNLLPKIDGLLINDSEAQLLTGEKNLVKAGKAVLALGPKFVILKKGEHGAMLFSGTDVYVFPAFPTENVIDPTGAGDSFAGGILGYLASHNQDPIASLQKAMAYGTVVASLTVEGFGLDRLRNVTRLEIDNRVQQYRNMLQIA